MGWQCWDVHIDTMMLEQLEGIGPSLLKSFGNSFIYGGDFIHLLEMYISVYTIFKLPASHALGHP